MLSIDIRYARITSKVQFYQCRSSPRNGLLDIKKTKVFYILICVTTKPASVAVRLSAHQSNTDCETKSTELTDWKETEGIDQRCVCDVRCVEGALVCNVQLHELNERGYHFMIDEPKAPAAHSVLDTRRFFKMTLFNNWSLARLDFISFFSYSEFHFSGTAVLCSCKFVDS